MLVAGNYENLMVRNVEVYIITGVVITRVDLYIREVFCGW